MDKFFNPKSVAIVGASSKKGKIGYEILHNVIKSGVKAYPVNPSYNEIDGLRCYPRISDIDERVDLAVIAINAESTVDAIEECGKKGIKHVVIISGGFKETGKHELEERLIKTAKKYGIRIIGPNCIGVFNGVNRFNTFFQQNMQLPNKGKVAIITQSGTFGIAVLEKLAHESIGVSKFVSYGNKSDVNEVDIIKYLEDDEETGIIGIYAEDFEKEFFDMEFKKPVIVLKGGRSEAGKKAAALHTGAMATNYRIFHGVAMQKNIIVAEDFMEFFSIIKIMSMNELPQKGKVKIITNGAGPAVMICDFIEDAKYLKLVSPPVDLTGSAVSMDYINAIERSDEADIIILIFVFQDAPLAATVEEMYKKFKKDNKTYVALALGGKFVEEQVKKLASIGIPTIEEARYIVTALDKIVRYRRKNEGSGNR